MILRPMPKAVSSTISEKEINKFNNLSAEWWDINGPMAPLHKMNPTRLVFIVQTLVNHFKVMKNKEILDVGCGGGLVAEPLARLGAKVTGIDGAEELIEVAKIHANTEKLNITYRTDLTETLLREKKRFDAITALEVIEHVPDPAQFVAEISKLLKPGGIVIFSTLNRNLASMTFGVVAAEYILRWLPVGTHDWQKFVKPSELFSLCQDAGLTPIQTMGLNYNPLDQEFSLDEKNLKINYFLVAKK
jgi:2-polyprenyl-6-hydroxyphenyl methylase/3-demethylubiquinone-9 3-methyltransferase